MNGKKSSEIDSTRVPVHRAVKLLFDGPPIDPDTKQPVEPSKLREWHVHHEDCIPSNNEIDNLGWLRASDHHRVHNLVV
jgi:hypothetical protein